MTRRDLPERTFVFATRVVRFCRELDRVPGVSRSLSRQLLKSASSIGANVEEGQGSQSRADFVAKHSTACKEARETLYWLRLISATVADNQATVAELTKEANELVAILTTIVKKTRKNDA